MRVELFRASVSWRLKYPHYWSYLCRRSRTVHVGLIIQLLELLQGGAWLLGQTNNDRLAMVVANGQSRRRALLGGLEQVVYAVAVDLEVFQRNLDLCGAIGVFLDFLAPSVYGAQHTWDNPTVFQFPASAHRVCLARAGTAVGKDGKIEAIEEVFDRRRD